MPEKKVINGEDVLVKCLLEEYVENMSSYLYKVFYLIFSCLEI